MRVIAGTHKGRRLEAPKGAHTRPTGDRVREAAFALLGPVDGASVLDLFAGSGALGIEALSRGARQCLFVDDDRAACRAIRQNLERLELTGAIVDCRDVVAVLRERRARGARYDVVLADPPYGRWDAFEQALGELVPGVLAADGVVAVESDARTEPQLPLDLVTTRRYGSARVTIFRHR